MSNEQPGENINPDFVNPDITSDQLAWYRENGYLTLGRTLTDVGLSAMRRQCMAAWDEDKGAFDPNKNWRQNALLPNIHHRSEVVRHYYFRGPLTKVATRLIGPNVKGATSQLTFKMRGNNIPFDWHQDNGYGELDPPNAISCLTALDDTDLDNGCLWIVPGSHKQGQEPEQRVAREGSIEGADIHLKVDESKAIPMPLKAGECLVFHCWTLHKSEGNKSTDRDRRILFLRYADADAVEVRNNRRPRLGRLVAGKTAFPEVKGFEAEL